MDHPYDFDQQSVKPTVIFMNTGAHGNGGIAASSKDSDMLAMSVSIFGEHD